MAAKSQKMTPEERSLLSELYQEYHLQIFSYVHSVTRDKEIADDIVSDTFATACEKLDQLMEHPNKAGWLYVTAQNKVKEFYRRLKSSEISLEKMPENESVSFHSPYGIKDLEITLEKALTPAEHKRFLRYFVWNHTLQEMADLENTTKENMSVRLSRLRDKIRREL